MLSLTENDGAAGCTVGCFVGCSVFSIGCSVGRFVGIRLGGIAVVTSGGERGLTATQFELGPKQDPLGPFAMMT